MDDSVPFPSLLPAVNASPAGLVRSSSRDKLPVGAAGGIAEDAPTAAVASSSVSSSPRFAHPSPRNAGHAHEAHSAFHSPRNGHGHSHGPSVRNARSVLGQHGPHGADDLEAGRPQHQPPRRVSMWRRMLQTLWLGSDSRRVLIFVGLTFAYMTAQMILGFVTLSTGLVSFSFHTMFDVAALSASLAAMIYARKKSDFAYSYGYGRSEVLAGFSNATYLIFVASFQFMEAFHHTFKQEEHDDTHNYFSVVGVAIDLFGLIMLRHHATLPDMPITNIPATGPASRASVPLGPHMNGAQTAGHAQNMHGVFLHVLADLVVHVGFLGATYATHYSNVQYAHVVSSIIVSFVIVQTVVPLFKQTGSILLQTAGPSEDDIKQALIQISTLDGVLETKHEHWWRFAPGVNIGTLRVRVRADADPQVVLKAVTSRLRKLTHNLTVQIERDTPVSWMLPTMPPASASSAAVAPKTPIQ